MTSRATLNTQSHPYSTHHLNVVLAGNGAPLAVSVCVSHTRAPPTARPPQHTLFFFQKVRSDKIEIHRIYEAELDIGTAVFLTPYISLPTTERTVTTVICVCGGCPAPPPGGASYTHII